MSLTPSFTLDALVSLKSRSACVVFTARPGRNSRGSVLPQLGPLGSTIHSSVSWVRRPGPSWILSLGFIGCQLIYPLYTFQMIGLSLQGRRKAARRGKTRFFRVFRPSPRGCGSAPDCNIPVPKAAPAPLFSTQRMLLLHLPAVHPGRDRQPVCSGCYGNRARSVGTLDATGDLQLQR